MTLKNACTKLLDYRQRAGAINLQVEKLDDHLAAIAQEMGKPQSITIIGREWVHSRHACYQSATVLVDGEWAGFIEMFPGSGDRYLEVAALWLKENGYAPDLKKEIGIPPEPLFRYCERKEIVYTHMKIEVGSRGGLL